MNMKPSGWGIALRVLGVLSTLFAGLGIIGIIGAMATDDYSGGDAVLGSLILVIPPIVVAVLLFRGAERVDKWAVERAARRAAQAAAARPTPPQPALLQTQPRDESQKAKAAEEKAAKRRQIEAERQAAKEEQEAKRAERKAARAARRKEREEKRAAAAAAARERAQAEQERKDREGYSTASGDWVPPKPLGTLVDPWAPGQSLEVVGEHYRQRAFVRLLGRKPGFDQYGGVEVYGEGILVPDPNNPYGGDGAVAVYFGGEHVGYLAREDADRYFPTLESMHGNGVLVRVRARVWASRPSAGGDVNARVTLVVPEPAGMFPSNDFPDAPYAVIPTGRRIQVTKEEEHMDVLAGYVRRGVNVDNHVAASLRSINEIRPRSSYECVQVEIDGQRVGVLTKGQSDKLLPLVRHIEQRGYVPIVRAVVKGTKLKADVVLNTADAETIDEDWLDDLGEAITDANIDKMPATTPRPDFDWDD
ncbi:MULTISPECIES: hypothetical protein [unclassified Actinomyces]|uniref:hypothetical protein n=1 Tax=unclassified Actinomyces TaxID=2609248 RepID=UPI0011BE0A54|nr:MULTISPECIES: hypothetical protein [unclassified Actinomyces]